MKILILSPFSPLPLEHNGLTKNLLDMIKYLYQKYEIWLLTFCLSEEEIILAEQLKEYCYHVETVLFTAQKENRWKRRFTTLLTRRPSFLTMCDSPEMKKKFINLTKHQNFDIVHFQATQMAQYLEFLDINNKSATILHEIDVNIVRLYREFRIANSLFAKIYRFKDWLNMFLYEPLFYEKFDKIIALSQQDKDVLVSFNNKLNVSIIPIAVDDSYFNIIPENSEEPNILFFGSYGHPPNVDGALYFCKEIYPLIEKDLPGVKLYITGGSPPDVIQLLSNEKNIFVTGYVENLNDYLSRATVCVSPLRFGAGQKTKILTAMAAGKAVVSTQLGIESLEVKPDRDLMVANSPEEFAQKTLLLLNNPQIRNSIGTNGRKLVKEKYSWSNNINMLESLYKELVSRKNE